MENEECDHDQLYAIVVVKFKIPIEHNSAAEISRVRKAVEYMLEDSGCRVWEPEIGTTIGVVESDGTD